MLATLTVPQTRELTGSSSAASTVPSNSENWPRTFAIIRCRILNPTLEWAGSIVQMPAGTRIIPPVSGAVARFAS